jgi:signal transduction histidine kinase
MISMKLKFPNGAGADRWGCQPRQTEPGGGSEGAIALATAPRVRVRVAGPPAEARRLALRLSRAGIPALPDDGESRAELIVALAETDLPFLRSRAGRLVAVGQPTTESFQAGADDVVPAAEPQVLFRRVHALIERADLEAREQRLAARLRALEESLAEVAHDLRSPLHAAMGHGELLAKDTDLNAEQRKSAEAVVRQGGRALALAERILEGAGRPEDTELRVAAVRLNELIDAAVTGAAASAQAKGITLTAHSPSSPVTLRADRELLARLLDNLIANAIRHTPQGGEVEASVERLSPRVVRLCVRDSGVGIDATLLPKLLAGLGGGRGLRISRAIAERHGGELWAESTKGQGSRFFVELPLQIPSARPRVLIVSDDGKWAKEIARALRTSCEVVHTTTDNAHLNGKHTDLVVVEAPAKGRTKSLSALRNEAKDAQVPVVDLPPTLGAAQLARTLLRLTA